MNHLQDEDGVRSIPTITTWRSIREDIAAAFESVAGPLPAGEKCDLAMKVEEEVDCGSYVRQLITYAATENCRTPAYLCIPKACLSDAPTRAPAVLCLHGTDQEVGHGTVVGLSDKENRSYASELAERGFVTFAPHNPCESPALPVSLRDCPDVRHDRRLLEWSCEESSPNRACSSRQSS